MLDVLHLKAEVVEALLASGPLCQKGHADDAVADMSPTGIGFAGLVYHSGRDLLHAKNGLVELDLFVIVFRMGGNVPDLGEHLNSPFPVRWLL